MTTTTNVTETQVSLIDKGLHHIYLHQEDGTKIQITAYQDPDGEWSLSIVDTQEKNSSMEPRPAQPEAATSDWPDFAHLQATLTSKIEHRRNTKEEIRCLLKGNDMLNELIDRHGRGHQNYREWTSFWTANIHRLRHLQRRLRNLDEEIAVIVANPTWRQKVETNKALKQFNHGADRLRKLGYDVQFKVENEKEIHDTSLPF